MSDDRNRPDAADLVDRIKILIAAIECGHSVDRAVLDQEIDALYDLATIGGIDAVAAMRDTIEYGNHCGMNRIEAPMNTSLSYKHICSMLDKIELGGFSYGKQCRWLGWVQAAVVADGRATLEDMKAINMRHRRGD